MAFKGVSENVFEKKMAFGQLLLCTRTKSQLLQSFSTFGIFIDVSVL